MIWDSFHRRCFVPRVRSTWPIALPTKTQHSSRWHHILLGNYAVNVVCVCFSIPQPLY